MKTSIIILTHNELPITIQCLNSIRAHTKEDYELIVVDNGSTDGTVEYLKLQHDILLYENPTNLGFAKGCNQGTQLATGENLMFLNNDTVVTDHWLGNMLRVLYENERVGMVGPVTNYSSGHQRIPVTYGEIGGLDVFARRHCKDNAGCYVDVRRLIGFCILIKQEVLYEVGGFDERFGLGNYEDDDLCLRVIRKGYLLRVVHDSFIHHIGHMTIRHLKSTDLSHLLQSNAEKAADKWGTNIHELIYKPGITISLCMVVLDAESTIRQSIASIADEVNEIIIVDLGSTDQTMEIANQYTEQVYAWSGNASEENAAHHYAFEKATQDYLLWLEQGDALSKEEIRRMCGLKLTINGLPTLVSFHPNEEELSSQELIREKAIAGDIAEAKPRYLVKRSTGFMLPPKEA